MLDKILCLHQGSELYGSDRSFLSAIESISSTGTEVHSILPSDGELAPLLRDKGSVVEFYPYGILRKQKLKKPFLYACEILRAVFFYVRKFRSYDVVYINTTVMLSALLASGLYRFSSKKVYCHIREIPDRKSIIVFKLLLVFSGAKLIFNSQATQSSFKLPGDVVYNGVEELYPAIARRRITPVKNILLIGRINTWKGQSLLIDALETLSESESLPFKIRIVGSPYEGYEYLEKELVNRVEGHSSLSENVQFFSFCSDPAEHYEWADYVLVPSIKPEPFGRVAIEAFSVGKPVIAAAHGGLIEIVTDSHDGYLFEPANVDSLCKVLMSLSNSDSEEYRQVSLRAKRTYLERFSMQSYKENILVALGV
jgi:glycosyltransferase involved in cell wall biosynthesis